jgi:hypothetical protein
MTDERLDEIKTKWNIPVTLPMSVPWGKDDVVWLVQEVERLREDLKKAQEKAAIYERDWYEAKSEFGTAIAKLNADIAQERLKWEATRRSMLQTRDVAVKARDEVYDLLRGLGWESHLLQETAVEFIQRLLASNTVDRRWDLP